MGSALQMSSILTKHGSHVDGNLRIIVLFVYYLYTKSLNAKRHNFLCRRHGWSRAFTLALEEELQTLDYAALKTSSKTRHPDYGPLGSYQRRQ